MPIQEALASIQGNRRYLWIKYVINLWSCPQIPYIWHSQQDIYGPQDESLFLRLTLVYAQHNKFVHCNQ
jgi:hypothetical protein